MREGIAGDVGEGDKKRPFDYEDPCSSQGEDFVLVDAKIRL